VADRARRLDGDAERVLFATVIVLATLVPAFFLDGQPGVLPDIAISYVLAIVASCSWR
jgi:hypothetical protein